MCGICGIVDFSEGADRATVERMSGLLRHRGPDDTGMEVSGPAALGMTRLSIIDLSGGHQPMTNEDGTLWMVYNGEIYNYRTLRAELLGRGHTLKTVSDGETILHLYEDHGLDFVHHLNGMFTVALWDTRSRRLVLARDRMGVKPLYVAVSGRRLAFASETKALLEVDWVGRTPDPEAIVSYMNFSAIPCPRTSFMEIQKLPAGHVATFDESGWATRRYWDISYDHQRAWKESEALDAVDETLRDAVRLRLISDVPLGVFLSGGVDSSLVAAMAAQFSSAPVEVFSIGYGKEGASQDELRYAGMVASRYGMNHHALVLDSSDLLRDVERVTWFLDEPVGDPAAFLTLSLSEFTRRRVTVALSGLGGDELFGGYRRYHVMKYQPVFGRIPAWARRGILDPVLRLLPDSRANRLLDAVRVVRRLSRTIEPDVKTTWARSVSYLPPCPVPLFTGAMQSATRETFASVAFEEHWSRVAHLADPVDQAMYMDAKMYLADQLLLLQDKMSMAVSLEARVPFMDYRLVELAATIPASMKIRGMTLKFLLKKLAERYVPRECIYRKKRGFSPPLLSWMRGPLREQVRDALTPARVKDRGVFRVEAVEWLKREFYDRGHDLSVELYQVFLLEIWLRLYADGGGRRYAGTVSPARGGRV